MGPRSPINVGTAPVGQQPKFIRPEYVLMPDLPPALHGVNPRTIMGQQRWDELRRVAYRENNSCCWACGRSTKLHAHEVYAFMPSCATATFLYVIALCELCHAFVHFDIVSQENNLEWTLHVMSWGKQVTEKALTRGAALNEFLHDILPEGSIEGKEDLPWRLIV